MSQTAAARIDDHTTHTQTAISSHAIAVEAGGPAANDPPRSPGRAFIDPTDHLDFVRRVAIRIARNLPAHVSLEDLVSAGTVGLLDALDRYDPAKSDRFETFAEFRVKGAILDELRRYDMMARNARAAAKRLARATQSLTAKLGRPPTEDELADGMDLSVKELRKLVSRVGNVRVLSLDELSDPHNDERNFEPAAKDLGPEEIASINETHAHLRAAISNLPQRQQMILEMYYQRDMTLKQIGLQVGVTESRVCQIVGEATGKLRRMMTQPRACG